MRTYSHALLTFAAARALQPRSSVPAALAALGAVFPDLPVAAGGLWLWTKRGLFDRDQLQREACAKPSFAAPDTALHSVVPIAAALALCAVLWQRDRATLTFLLGWAGHVATDALTHGSDARRILWPLSEHRFRSPVSYWEAGRNGRPFTLVEHAVLLIVVAWMFRSGLRRSGLRG